MEELTIRQSESGRFFLSSSSQKCNGQLTVHVVNPKNLPLSFHFVIRTIKWTIKCGKELISQDALAFVHFSVGSWNRAPRIPSDIGATSTIKYLFKDILACRIRTWNQNEITSMRWFCPSQHNHTQIANALIHCYGLCDWSCPFSVPTKCQVPTVNYIYFIVIELKFRSRFPLTKQNHFSSFVIRRTTRQ